MGDVEATAEQPRDRGRARPRRGARGGATPADAAGAASARHLTPSSTVVAPAAACAGEQLHLVATARPGSRRGRGPGARSRDGPRASRSDAEARSACSESPATRLRIAAGIAGHDLDGVDRRAQRRRSRAVRCGAGWRQLSRNRVGKPWPPMASARAASSGRTSQREPGRGEQQTPDAPGSRSTEVERLAQLRVAARSPRATSFQRVASASAAAGRARDHRVLRRWRRVDEPRLGARLDRAPGEVGVLAAEAANASSKPPRRSSSSRG